MRPLFLIILFIFFIGAKQAPKKKVENIYFKAVKEYVQKKYKVNPDHLNLKFRFSPFKDFKLIRVRNNSASHQAWIILVSIKGEKIQLPINRGWKNFINTINSVSSKHPLGLKQAVQFESYLSQVLKIYRNRNYQVSCHLEKDKHNCHFSPSLENGVSKIILNSKGQLMP